MAFDYKNVIDNLPELPGVYRLLGADGAVLYVGKAVHLKRRVSSYFQKSHLSPRIQLMVRQIAAIETTVTRSESEALILENNLIKALVPRYNILFRDDKSYPYLMLTGRDYPQMAYYRGTLHKGNHYFGPYPNSFAVRESIQILQKVFRLRTCEDSVFANRSRPCLLYQIKRCSGPCIQAIPLKDYQQDVANTIAFLQGRQSELIQHLTEQMLQAAEDLNFEEAAQRRDQIQALAKVQEKQYVSSNSRQQDSDVIAVVEQSGHIAINLVMIRGGRHLGDKSFFPIEVTATATEVNQPTGLADDDLNDALEAFLMQHYEGVPLPSVIITNRTVSATVKAYLEKEKRLYFSHNPVAERKVWLEMACKNAQLALEQRLNSKITQQQRLAKFNALFDLDHAQRLECFDISHTMGEATVASCVVYDHNDMQPKEYRRYTIETAAPGDDYAAMREVLERRYGRLLAEEGEWPDVILIDGGKGQVGVAQSVLNELGVVVPIIGVAKGEGRKPGLETLIYPAKGQSFQLSQADPVLHLVQTIRDEAHRFAITGHRSKRAKVRTQSSLEQIPGIGAKRRQRLLTRFGGLRGVVAASVEELAKVEGISPTLAEKIYQALH